MKICVIDDNKEEIQNAYSAVSAAGHEVVLEHIRNYTVPEDWMRKIEESDGLITDLCWNPLTTGYNTFEHYQQHLPPAGLLAVIHALKHQKPFVICTNGTEQGGHHSEALGWIYDGYFGTEVFSPNWEEHKDWKKAVEMIEQQVAATQPA